MRIIFISHTAAGGIFRVGSHHLSRELARRDHEVFHVSTPVSVAHVLRARRDPEVRRRLEAASKVTVDPDGVSHLVPFTIAPIGKSPAWLRRIDASARTLSWAGPRRSLRSPDVVFLDQPLLLEYTRSLRPKTLIYRPTDAHFDPAARTAEVRALRSSDGIAATSAQTLSSVTEGTDWAGPTTVIENGVEFDHFHRPNPSGERSGVVYIGALDSRFDWELLHHLATNFSVLPFRIAGPLPGPPPRSMPSNVTLLGPVPYAEAPALLGSAQVGLLPLSTDPANASRSPMKYYEYLSSGLSVVATRVPALERRASPNVRLYSTKQDAVDALRSALEASETERTAGIESAREHSWSACARDLESFVQAIEGVSADV